MKTYVDPLTPEDLRDHILAAVAFHKDPDGGGACVGKARAAELLDAHERYVGIELFELLDKRLGHLRTGRGGTVHDYLQECISVVKAEAGNAQD